MQSLQITGIPALTGTYDNYIWVLYKDQTAWVVDPGESRQVIDFLREHQLTLQGILVTHRHFDHVDGIEELINHSPNATVFGPEKTPLDLIEIRLKDGDKVKLFTDYELQVMETPGHTEDHISYHNRQHLFCGDTLFTGGCGRILGGTSGQFADSIIKLRQLDDSVAFYCAHEYTQDNLAFAQLIEPNNLALDKRAESFSTDYPKTLADKPLSTLGEEKQTNPFMRFDMDPLKSTLMQNGAEDNPESLFASLRNIKDDFDHGRMHLSTQPL